jgi:hypothetical protein
MNKNESEVEENKDFRYVLVGNIIDKYYYGENKEIRSGSKNFRAGAKVYIFPKYGGMGHEKMPVFGVPKNSRIRKHLIVSTNMIKNVRLLKTYDKTIIKKVNECDFYNEKTLVLNIFKSEHNELLKFADYMNKNHIEINI